MKAYIFLINILKLYPKIHHTLGDIAETVTCKF